MLKKKYIWPCILAIALTQTLVYITTRLFLTEGTLHNLALPLDLRIPFVPAWVTYYFLVMISWAVNCVWILSESPGHARRITASYVIALLLCGAVFLIYPGTIDRPVPTGNGIFECCVRLLYRIDPPTNLCPSLHVLSSYFAWRGTWGCRRIPGWYKFASFVMLALVCPCILLVKQHALVDIPAAVIVSEIALLAGRHITPVLFADGAR